MSFLERPRFITCVMPKGKAIDVERRLHEEKGLDSVNISSGRGGGKRGRLEVDIMTVVVNAHRAEEIFEFIYYAAGVDEYHGGFMYQGRAVMASKYELPKVDEEES